MKELVHHIRAGRSIIQVITDEEDRAVLKVAETALDNCLKGKYQTSYSIWNWSVTKGLKKENGTPCLVQVMKSDSNGVARPAMVPDEQGKSCDPITAIKSILLGGVSDRSLVIMRDFHLHLKQPNPTMIRLLKEFVSYGRSKKVHIIIIGCSGHTIPELNKEITTMDLPLPDPMELGVVFDTLICAVNLKREVIKSDQKIREQVIKSVCGLTANEASDAITFSIYRNKKLCIDTISSIKTEIIRRNGVVDVVDTRESIAGVGGLSAVKAWLKKRTRLFSDKAKEFGAEQPKGVMVIGISGTGKSLVAKSVASELGIPMLRLDGGKIFGSLVGESEKNMRSALKVADAMAPCVLFVDELEKAMAGLSSSSSCDGGTTSRVIGTFLQWMQDQTGVFVVATANDVTKLPPELIRRGRFDQIFFVDIPSKSERKQIWDIQISRVKRNSKDFDLDKLADSTEGFTGAEIECVVKDGMTNAFSSEEEPTTETFHEAIKETVPLSSTMKEKIDSMRKWAVGRAINASGN